MKKIKKSSTKEVIYQDIPEWGDIDTMKIVKDFLPPPEELIFRHDTKKITIALSERSIAFFKQQAKKHDVSYQVMIRELLDTYVEKHELSK